jgi:glycerol-3-phosphate O-acyltransferase
MTRTLSLPLWLVVLLLAVAAWAAIDRLLVPSVRWVLRRRLNRVIAEVNTRLKIEIKPFQLTKRQVLIDRLLYDPQVLAAAAEHARAARMPREVAMEQVARYAREIVPSFNAYLYFRLGTWIARRVARLLYRVRLGVADEVGLAAVDPAATIVFLMNHRSNMDYVLVAYLAADRTALSYAVGEWARIWPLQTLIRSLGAYFVRRDSRDPLYRRVLERYIHMATEGGVTQAVYPEGGLSRDGRLRPPKLGLLDYMLRGFDPAGPRDLVFIPVGINYDRTLEDRTLLLDRDARGDRNGRDSPAPRRRGLAAVGTTLGFVGKNLALAARSRWHRFGYACVNFGTPVSMKERLGASGRDLRALPREERFREIATLADELMAAIGRVVPVLPVPLVATVFLRQAERPLSELEIKARAWELTAELAAAGAQIYVPRRDQDYAIAVGLRALTLRHLVDEEAGLYRARAAETPLLSYYAGSISHLLSAPAVP